MFSGDSLPDPMLISPNDNIVEMSTGGDDLLSRALEDIFNQTEDQEEEGGGQGQETITLNGGQGQVEVVLAGGGQQEEGDVDDPEEDGEQEEQGDNSKTVFPHCEICGKEFASKKNLRLHLAEIHQGKRGEFVRKTNNKGLQGQFVIKFLYQSSRLVVTAATSTPDFGASSVTRTSITSGTSRSAGSAGRGSSIRICTTKSSTASQSRFRSEGEKPRGGERPSKRRSGIYPLYQKAVN